MFRAIIDRQGAIVAVFHLAIASWGRQLRAPDAASLNLLSIWPRIICGQSSSLQAHGCALPPVSSLRNRAARHDRTARDQEQVQMVDCRRSRGDLRSARDPLRASDRVRAELCHHAGLGETTAAFWLLGSTHLALGKGLTSGLRGLRDA